ncbi:MAG: hypothetical protein AAFN10_21260 [Bacteroidota bacterium]
MRTLWSIIFVMLMSSSPSCSNESQAEPQNLVSPKEKLETGTETEVETEAAEKPEDDSIPAEYPYSFGHTDDFYPGIFAEDSLVKIDSIFHRDILSQINGYSFPYTDAPNNYYLSKQRSVAELEIVSVSLYWGVCYEGVRLLILDQDQKLIQDFALTEWYSSCDMEIETTTTFESDSIINQNQ